MRCSIPTNASAVTTIRHAVRAVIVTLLCWSSVLSAASIDPIATEHADIIALDPVLDPLTGECTLQVFQAGSSRYDSFGVPGNVDGTPNAPSVTGNTLAFQGLRGINWLGYNARNRWLLPQHNIFMSPDAMGGWGGNRYGGMGQDGVNNSDPLGLDTISVDKDGWVMYQRQFYGKDVGPAIPIGTTDGTWITLGNGFGPGAVSHAALAETAGNSNTGLFIYYPSDIAGVIRKAQSAGGTGSITPVTDFFIGATKVGYEPLALLKTGAKGAYHLVRYRSRMSSEDLNTQGYSGSGLSVFSFGHEDSSLFQYGAQAYDQGDSGPVVGLKVFGQVVVRGNPVTGLPLAGYDVYEGFNTGNYEQAGGGTVGLGMNLIALRGISFEGGTPTFNSWGQTIRTIGVRGFVDQQSAFPTFRSWDIMIRGRMAGLSNKQVQLQINEMVGDMQEGFVEQGLRRLYGDANVETQVQLRPFNANGSLNDWFTTMDAAVLDGEGTANLLVEAKGSGIAGLRPRQIQGHPLITANGAFSRGIRIGRVPAQSVIVLRWVNGGWIPVLVPQSGEKQ